MTSYEDPKNRVTLSGAPPVPGFDDKGAPAPINPATGQHYDYWVLPESERKKGFVRPYRDAYKHVGIRPRHPTRPLTEDELRRHRDSGYVAYEKYPDSEAPRVGRYWTQAQLDSGCNTVTTMGVLLSETYARDPSYYGSTFCVGCRTHFRVDEFTWTADGQVVGS